VADARIVTGFLIVFLVLRENSYASSIIEVKAGQHVTRRGPTAINGQWLIQCRWYFLSLMRNDFSSQTHSFVRSSNDSPRDHLPVPDEFSS